LKGQDCPKDSENKKYKGYPLGARHLHFSERDGRSLILHKKSETLWAVPSFVPSSVRDNPGAKIILASDRDALPAVNPRTGTGVYSDNLLPVRVPSLDCSLEAFVRLAERDYNEDRWAYGACWFSTIVGMLKNEELYHPKNRDRYMDPRCNEFLQSVLDMDKCREAMRILKQSLREPK
jgi:hypothetical protein